MSQHSHLYGNARWRRRRAAQLRAYPMCRLCWELHDRVTEATVADHCEPHRGDPEKFWTGALQSLCASCHSTLKQQQETSGAMRGNHRNGDPIDRQSAWYDSRGGGARR